MCSLVVDSAGGSHCISIGGQHTQMRRAIVRGNTENHGVQVIVGVVSGVVLDFRAHGVSCCIQQHILHHLELINNL